MKKLLLIAVLTLSVVGRAQELVTLTVPIATANATNVRLERITIDLPAQSVQIQWRVRDASGGTIFQENAVYSTPAPAAHPSQPTGATLLHTINTANFTTNSMSKRIFQQLQSDGYIAAGSIAGTPE